MQRMIIVFIIATSATIVLSILIRSIPSIVHAIEEYKRKASDIEWERHMSMEQRKSEVVLHTLIERRLMTIEERVSAIEKKAEGNCYVWNYQTKDEEEQENEARR